MTEKHTTLILVRHGKATTTGEILPGRTPGLHLSAEGKEQAKAVADYLSKHSYKPAAIYTSPLERTVETTQPISEAFGLEPRTDESLLEADFGDWTGQKLADLRKLDEWQTVQQTPSKFRFPNGESFKDMQQRIVAGLEQIGQNHNGETVIAVSHADMIKAAMAHYLNMNLDDFQRLTINPCSMSAVITGANVRVLFMNQSASGSVDPNIG